MSSYRNRKLIPNYGAGKASCFNSKHEILTTRFHWLWLASAQQVDYEQRIELKQKRTTLKRIFALEKCAHWNSDDSLSLGLLFRDRKYFGDDRQKITIKLNSENKDPSKEKLISHWFKNNRKYSELCCVTLGQKLNLNSIKNILRIFHSSLLSRQG